MAWRVQAFVLSGQGRFHECLNGIAPLTHTTRCLYRHGVEWFGPLVAISQLHLAFEVMQAMCQVVPPRHRLAGRLRTAGGEQVMQLGTCLVFVAETFRRV